MQWLVLGTIAVVVWLMTRWIENYDINTAFQYFATDEKAKIDFVCEGSHWRGAGIGFIVGMWLTFIVFANFAR